MDCTPIALRTRARLKRKGDPQTITHRLAQTSLDSVAIVEDCCPILLKSPKTASTQHDIKENLLLNTATAKASNATPTAAATTGNTTTTKPPPIANSNSIARRGPSNLSTKKTTAGRSLDMSMDHVGASLVGESPASLATNLGDDPDVEEEMKVEDVSQASDEGRLPKTQIAPNDNRTPRSAADPAQQSNESSNTTPSALIDHPPKPSADGAPDADAAVAEPLVTVLESSQFVALSDPAAKVQELAKFLASDDWYEQYQATETIRALALFHKELLTEEILAQVFPFVCSNMNSLRSAQSRNALKAAQDLYRITPPSKPHFEYADQMVDILLVRSTNDKKFIAKAAAGTIKIMVNSIPSPEVATALMDHFKPKSIKNATQVAVNLALCAERMQVDQFKAMAPRVILTAASLEGGRSLEAKDPARRLLRFLHKTMGAEEFHRSAKDVLPVMDLSRVSKVVDTTKRKPIGARAKSIKDVMLERRKLAKQQSSQTSTGLLE